MIKMEQRVGEVHNKLKIVRVWQRDKDRRAMCECKCSCGGKITTQLSSVTRNLTKSCGCLRNSKPPFLIDGVLLADIRKSKIGRVYSSIKDKCYNFKSHNYKEYGGKGIHMYNEWTDIHEGLINFYRWSISNGYNKGMKIDRLDYDKDYTPDNCIWWNKTEIKKNNIRMYKSWSGMKSRCTNTNVNGYKFYGGRGITYCREWETFYNFYTWAINNGYSDDLTIDRINVNGNYEPSNCRWANNSLQGFNKRPVKNKTGHTGVYYDKRRDNYYVEIQNKHVGSYKTLEEAILVRSNKEIEIYGEHPVK